MDASAIERGLKTRWLGRHIHAREVVSSTNDLARQLAVEGAPEGTVVVAEEQTAGRGRLGRRWRAPAGSSLIVSILLRPPLPAGRAAQLSMAVALAAARSVEAQTGLVVGLKWPNDLLVRDRKLAGLLAELSFAGDAVEWVVIGLGLNVNLDFAAAGLRELEADATSLSRELGRPVDRIGLLQALLNEIEVHLDRVYRGEALEAEYTTRLAWLGEIVSAVTPAAVMTGRVEGIDARGALRLRREDGSLIELAVADVNNLRSAEIGPS